MVELLRSNVCINAIVVGHGDCKSNVRLHKVAHIVRPLSKAEL